MKFKFFVFILSIVFIVVGCSKKSEYYIKPPEDNKFNLNSVSNLSDSDIQLIREYIPTVIKWYNSVDIAKPQNINFISNEIKTGGDKLFENEIYQSYLNNFTSGKKTTEEEKEKFKQINTVNAIYGQISEIMMTNEITYHISSSEGSNNQEPKISIQKDSWVKLGDNIKEAIKFYYK